MQDADAVADAFDALSDPSRVAILNELARRFYETGDATTFSDLRRATGFDDAGRFNYHLSTLTERFVSKRDDGYAPTVPGLKAIESAVAGVYTDEPDRRSGRIDEECADCESQLTATYENHWISVACDDHGERFRTLVPATLPADVDLRDVLRYAVGEMWRRIDRATDGVCPVCRRLSLSLAFRERDDRILADLDCEYCHYQETNDARLFALNHPVVVSLFGEHGVDIRHRLPRDVADWVGRPEYVADDPTTVEITLSIDGDALTMLVDEHLDVRPA